VNYAVLSVHCPRRTETHKRYIYIYIYIYIERERELTNRREVYHFTVLRAALRKNPINLHSYVEGGGDGKDTSFFLFAAGYLYAKPSKKGGLDTEFLISHTTGYFGPVYYDDCSALLRHITYDPNYQF
jgi:hypothetical protein